MLAQLKNQLTFHIIHGMSQIEEDFRLKNLLTQLESLASKNKVMDSIYQDLSLVLQAENKDKTTVLLQCLAKINGVLYVQGKSDIPLENGIEETIVFDDVRREIFTWKYSEIAPLILALTKKEKNRLKTIEWYLANKPLIFADFRVIQALVRGLSDKSYDVRQYCSHILLELGTKERNASPSPELVDRYVTKENPLPIVEPTILVSELKKDFDINGENDMVERLDLITKLGKEKEKEWYCNLLESQEKGISKLQDKFWNSIIKKKIEYIEYLEEFEEEKYLERYVECCKLYIETCVKLKKKINYSSLNIISKMYMTGTPDKLIDFYLWVLDYLKNSKEKNLFLSALHMPFIKRLCLNETPKMYEFMECLSETDKEKCSGIYFVYDCLHLSIEDIVKKWKQEYLLLEQEDMMKELKQSLYYMRKNFDDEMEWEKLYSHLCYCMVRMIAEYDMCYARDRRFLEQLIKASHIGNEDPFRIQLGQYCYRILLGNLLKEDFMDYYDILTYIEILNILEYNLLNIPLDFTKELSGIKYSIYCKRLDDIFTILHKFYKKEELEQLKKKVLDVYFETGFEPEKSDELNEQLNTILSHLK